MDKKMDWTTANWVLAGFTKLLHLLGSLGRFFETNVFRLFSAHDESSPHSLTIEYSDGSRRRRASDIARPYCVVPHNLFEILAYGLELSNNGPCLGFRAPKTGKYQWLSYQTVTDRATNFGAGLMALGGKSDCEFLVGIFAKTNIEWTIAEYGCFAYGMATAPLYDSLGAEACQATVKLFDIEIMVCGSDEQVHTLLDGDQFPSKLRTIITIEQLSDERIVQIEGMGVKVLTTAQVEAIGKLNPLPLCPSSGNSLASLIFTSGTTGPSKGAMLTHANFMLEMKSFIQSVHPIRLNADDSALAIFPLAHILERIVEKIIHLHGGKVGYLSGGDISNLQKDAAEVQPTIFAFVPRLMNKLHDQIEMDIQKSLYRQMVGWVGLTAKLHAMHRGQFSKDTIWDRLLFKKYQKLLGGKVRCGLTGSAAADGDILNFTRAVFGCYIIEMYGQTESSGAITGTIYGDCTTGHVGIPFAGVEVKLMDVPEMGYFAMDQCGEICTRSKLNMRGYLNMPEKTAEAMDEDGWLHTGDIGMWTEVGKLKVFDRKKHIFKLSQGEYLAPERLESIFGRSNLITNIFVDGDSKYPYPVALVYPNYTALEISPDKMKRPNGAQSAHEEYLRQKIVEDLVRLAREAKLKSYEIPKKLGILEEPFSLQNNCITPSQKTRREVVRTLYRDQIRGLYEKTN